MATHKIRLAPSLVDQDLAEEFCGWLQEKHGYDAQIGTDERHIVDNMSPVCSSVFLWPLYRDFRSETGQ